MPCADAKAIRRAPGIEAAPELPPPPAPPANTALVAAASLSAGVEEPSRGDVRWTICRLWLAMRSC